MSLAHYCFLSSPSCSAFLLTSPLSLNLLHSFFLRFPCYFAFLPFSCLFFASSYLNFAQAPRRYLIIIPLYSAPPSSLPHAAFFACSFLSSRRIYIHHQPHSPTTLLFRICLFWHSQPYLFISLLLFHHSLLSFYLSAFLCLDSSFPILPLLFQVLPDLPSHSQPLSDLDLSYSCYFWLVCYNTSLLTTYSPYSPYFFFYSLPYFSKALPLLE